MVKLLVVDDEAIIRDGIIKSIEWEKYDIQIAGEASNGSEALEIARNVEPDIVIADIRMPVMDGLELSRRLKDMFPSVRLVLLTGYGEFEYAKKAIEFKVSEFVLKPVGAEKLVSVIIQLRDEINEERKKTQAIRFNELMLMENLPVIQKELINKLTHALCRDTEKNEILRTAERLGMDLTGPGYQVFILAIDNYFFCAGNKTPDNRELLFDSLLNIVKEEMASYTKGYICKNELGYFFGLVNTGNSVFNIISMCKHLQALISRHLNITVSIGIGRVKSNISCIYESYDEAFFALRSRVYKGKNLVLHMNDVAEDTEPAGTACFQSFIDDEKELLLSIKLIERSKVNNIYDALFERFITLRVNYKHIKSISLNIILAVFKEIGDMGISIEEQLDMQLDPFFEIEKYETAEDIKKWMKELTGKFIDMIENEKNEKYKSIVKIAASYIVKHYHETISLTTVADKVHVTPNYLSRVFSKEMGESFLEWVNKYRIEKAKELLTDNVSKTYEIAEKVGFNNYKQFLYNFQKYVGCSITVYKEKNL